MLCINTNPEVKMRRKLLDPVFHIVDTKVKFQVNDEINQRLFYGYNVTQRRIFTSSLVRRTSRQISHYLHNE